MGAFDNGVPVPVFKPGTDEYTGISILDKLINTATGVATAWWQYDNTKTYMEWQQQQAINSGQVPSSPIAVSGQNMLFWGLIGLGSVLMVKALKK